MLKEVFEGFEYSNQKFHDSIYVDHGIGLQQIKQKVRTKTYENLDDVENDLN